MQKEQPIQGQQSIERLVHFQCGACQRWSVGDAPERPYWYCPWCGTKQTMRTRLTSPEVEYVVAPEISTPRSE